MSTMKTVVRTMGRRVFSTAGPAKEEIACAGDMSVKGLCIQSVVEAVKNNLKPDKKGFPSDYHTGRWDVKTGDNYEKGKSYSYDHSN